jgi:hypothetical protein
MNSEIGLHGEYNLVIKRGDGTTEETGWFKNLILDQGLDRIGQAGPYSACINYCHIGTGTTTPATTQVGLSAFTAAVINSAATVVNAGSPTFSSAHTVPYAFALGAVVGNMTEIGVGWANAGNVLFSRALITDANSNPTTLTVTAIDQLTVYYKITLTPSTTIGTGTVTLAGTPYNYTATWAYMGSIFSDTGLLISSDFYSAYNASYNYYAAPASTTTLGANTTGLVGETGYYYGMGMPNGSTAAYTNGTYYRDTVYTLPIGLGNLAGGLGGVRPQLGSGSSCSPKFVFSPAIPKDNTKTLSLTFRTSWARG